METIEQLEAMGYRLVKAQAQIQHDLQVIEQRINQLREEQKEEASVELKKETYNDAIN